MIVFRYTHLLFAFLSVSIAAPVPRGDEYNFSKPPWPAKPGCVYYTHSTNLDEWYKTGLQDGRSFGVLPVVALTAPEDGKIVVVEVAENLPQLLDNQKHKAYSFFPRFVRLTFAARARRLSNGPFFINVGVPRTINIDKITWDEGEMLTAQLGQEGFNQLSDLVKERASHYGHFLVNSPWPLDGTACVGWVYYADSRHWLERSIGIMPVVVIERPRVGQVVVVEIGKSLSYLKPAEKQHAFKYFKDGTVLTFGTSNFVPLITEDIWINVAKPRIIDISALERNSPRATAQMEQNYIPYFADLLEALTRAKHFPNLKQDNYQLLINEERRKVPGSHLIE